MKKILSLLLALALCAGLSAPALAAGFSDVPAGHYAASAIDACVAKGIVSGYADGTFKPGNQVTRAQFCVMIARAFYSEELRDYETAENKAAGWFIPAVECLYLQAYDGGAMESTSFVEHYRDPAVMNQPINRYDAAKIVWFCTPSGIPSLDQNQMEQTQRRIADWASVPAQYYYPVTECFAWGVLTGLPDGSFGGDKTLNRGQACAVIDRMLNLPNKGTAAQPAAPAPQPTAPANGNPEIRCASCGYLMRAAGTTEIDFNNGGASNAFFNMCDRCNVWYLCQQCSQHRGDANFESHRHREGCTSGGTTVPVEDFYSPSYRSSVYYQRLKNVTLTGDYRQDILAVAASQIGYMGGRNESRLDGSGGGSHTEYSWALNAYGESDGAWCSEFASWCAKQAKIPSSILHASYTARADNFGGRAYTWADTVFAGGSYMPQPGDLMLISRSSGSISTSTDLDHTTIVQKVTQSGSRVTVTVIDGNSSNSVRNHDYSFTIYGGLKGYFVAPDYP